MLYVCLVHFDDKEVFRRMSEAEKRELDIASSGYDRELARSGNLVRAEALQAPESAVLVRVRDGRISATDGPFLETKEQLGGFILIEARDLNDAIRIAGGIPLAELEAVGVRRVSLGGGLARVALTALKRAGEEIRATGTFKFADDIVTTGWVNDLMRR